MDDQRQLELAPDGNKVLDLGRIGKKVDLDTLAAAIDRDFQDSLGKPPVRNAWKDLEGFNVVSLGDWLDLCIRADVPYVPASLVSMAPVESLLRYDETPADPDAVRFWQQVQGAKEPGTMLRWDCCSPLEVKARLARGEHDWHQDLLDGFVIDDPRAYDILFEYPGRDIGAWKRPWVEAALCRGYPVEYRCFVRDGQIMGISSYYPQRPLDWDEAVLNDLDRVTLLATRLEKTIFPPLKFPGPYNQAWGPDSVSFTADFMRLKNGELVFLEGGPPFGAGAHPCCFEGLGRPDEWHGKAKHSYQGIPVALEGSEEEE